MALDRCPGVEIVERLVPDGLWEIFLEVAPAPPARTQGGGRRRCDDRGVLAAVIFPKGELDWSRCAIDSVSVRAVKGGP